MKVVHTKLILKEGKFSPLVSPTSGLSPRTNVEATPQRATSGAPATILPQLVLQAR